MSTLYYQALANLRTVIHHLTKLKDETFTGDENQRQIIMEHIDNLQEILNKAMKAVCVSFCLSYPNILPDHVSDSRKSVSQC
jgi:hypothetical protein